MMLMFLYKNPGKKRIDEMGWSGTHESTNELCSDKLQWKPEVTKTKNDIFREIARTELKKIVEEKLKEMLQQRECRYLIGNNKDAFNNVIGYLDDAFQNDEDFKKWAERDE